MDKTHFQGILLSNNAFTLYYDVGVSVGTVVGSGVLVGVPVGSGVLVGAAVAVGAVVAVGNEVGVEVDTAVVEVGVLV